MKSPAKKSYTKYGGNPTPKMKSKIQKMKNPPVKKSPSNTTKKQPVFNQKKFDSTKKKVFGMK